MSRGQNRMGSKKTTDKPLFAERIVRSLAILLLGGLLALSGVPPFPALKQGGYDALQLVSELTQTRPKLLEPSSYSGSGVVTHDDGAVQPGYTLIQGILPGGPQVRMIDMNGQELHRWEIDFFDLWSDPDHVFPAENLPKSKFNYHTQGFWPLPDGSIVANVSDLGAVRLDMCSQPVWTLDRMTHHSVARTREGNFWFSAHIPLTETPRELLPRGFSSDDIARKLIGWGRNYNNSILLVSAKGETLKEFSVLQAVVDAGLEHALLASLLDFVADPTHLNDVEVVTAPLAERVDGVRPGDLLVSLRNMDMIAILDQDDGGMKWHKQGPWVRQHDPDIMLDGTIKIFNNRAKMVGGWVTSSQILSYDPATDSTKVLHPVGEEDRFFTAIMGAQQRLDNGNLLITETLAGRVFEATSQGSVVWDYRLPYDDETASLFEIVTRVPADYFDVETFKCEEN